MRLLRIALPALSVAMAVVPLSAHADFPGRHPMYLHALTELRGARWLVEHRPADAAVSGQEDIALQKIDDAIGELKKAGIDDGKNLQDHTALNTTGDHGSRLHQADELLHKAASDVNKEEDDPAAVGLKDRSLHHIHEAEGAVHRARVELHDGQ